MRPGADLLAALDAEDRAEVLLNSLGHLKKATAS
jgi:hypothetical protein